MPDPSDQMRDKGFLHIPYLWSLYDHTRLNKASR